MPLPLEEQLRRFPYDFKRELEPLHGGVAGSVRFSVVPRFGQASGGLFDFRLAFGKSLFAHRLLFSMAGFRRIAFSKQGRLCKLLLPLRGEAFHLLLERFAVVSGFFLGEAIRMPNQDITGVLFCATGSTMCRRPRCVQMNRVARGAGFLESTKWRAGVRIRIISGSAARRYLHADTMAFVQDNAGGTKIDVERKDVAGFQQFSRVNELRKRGTKLAFTQVEGRPSGYTSQSLAKKSVSGASLAAHNRTDTACHLDRFGVASVVKTSTSCRSSIWRWSIGPT